MFFNLQPENAQEKYENLLKMLGALSNLFSESNTPYLYYRSAERVFCRAFDALDHSRGDTAIDAGKGDFGIGLKTFLHGNGKTFQKVAEFNREGANFRKLSDPVELIHEIGRLRNERLDFAKNTHGVNSLLYHCITREKGKFSVSEEKMDYVNLEKIKNVESKQNTIHFNDGINNYSFSLTKSTLLKQFYSSPIYNFNVDIMYEPFEYLEGLLLRPEIVETLATTSEKEFDSVILPLYSERGGKNVGVGSGLNQWNAGGRLRKDREVYIPIPILVHKIRPGFFPDYNTPFSLVLPNGKTMSAKVSSGNKETPKALYSNPNTDLGEWLIDDILKPQDGKIITYELLEERGVDSVEISKIGDNTYAINFKKTGSYDDFKATYSTETEETDDDEEIE